MAPDDKKLAEIFAAHAGKPVGITLKPGPIISYDIDPNDPVLKALNDAARDARLVLQLWIDHYPHMRQFRRGLLHAGVQRDAGGVYRLAPDFRID